MDTIMSLPSEWKERKLTLEVILTAKKNELTDLEILEQIVSHLYNDHDAFYFVNISLKEENHVNEKNDNPSISGS
jgi:hypothetical protein